MPTSLPTLDKANLDGKKVLLRAGFDVAMEDGKVMDTERIEALIPTMQYILGKNASLIIISHQGRPKGKRLPEFSQKPITPILEKLLGRSVTFVDECVGVKAEAAVAALRPGQVLFLENLRYEPGEEGNDEVFGKSLSKLGDVYVNDAFTNCHRTHASMVQIPKYLPSYMGLQLQREVEELSRVVDDPKRPLVLIVSGAKMETKVPVIEQFLDKGDDILLGGCIANTFIAARGLDMGKSKYEKEWVERAQNMMLEAEKTDKADIHVPRDAVVASAPGAGVEVLGVPVESIQGDMAMFDIGPVTTERYIKAIEKAGMVVWNGPIGFYEVEEFAGATKKIAQAVAAATARGAITIIGGGDTIDFHVRYGLPLSAYTFVSTGGGAMLEFIGGKKLPAIEALRS